MCLCRCVFMYVCYNDLSTWSLIKKSSPLPLHVPAITLTIMTWKKLLNYDKVSTKTCRKIIIHEDFNSSQNPRPALCGIYFTFLLEKNIVDFLPWMNQNLKINTSLIFPGLPFSAHLHMLNPPATRNLFQLPEHLLEDDEQGGDHREDQDYK